MPIVELLGSVYGKVQGVGFRAKVKTYAEQLHLKGFVRNAVDQSVELCIQGEKEKIEQLISLLQQTFPEHIKSIKIQFHTPSQLFEEFKIVF